MSKVLEVFNAEDNKELKQAFKAIVVEQFKNELEELDVYLFDPRRVQYLIDEMYGEILNELKVEIKETLRNQMLEIISKGNFDVSNLLK
jgi:cellobiose-specific phosphotransferase system component IIB